MNEMKPNEKSIYSSMRISQIDVGQLEIETMAFGEGYPPDHVRFCYEITVSDASQEKVGWGKKIFEGSLKELIDLVTEKVEAK